MPIPSALGFSLFGACSQRVRTHCLDCKSATIASNPIGAFEKWYSGLIDEVAVWNEALEDDFIAFLAEGGSILGPPGDPGDFNMDGVVDTADFQIMADNFNGQYPREESYSKGDFDLNTRVDLKDFLAFREVFEAQGGSVAAVPEPSTFLVVTIASILLLSWRGRSCL